MGLIEFKDLPDTSTPLNAENLNNNFNLLKTKYWSGICEITSLPTETNWLVVPFNKIKTNTNQIIIENGIITVSEKIKSVKVSYNVRHDWSNKQEVGYYQMLNGEGGDIWATHVAHIAKGSQAIPSYSNFVIDTSRVKNIHLKMWASEQTNEVSATAYIYVEVLEEE